jgi:hypothetical protein
VPDTQILASGSASAPESYTVPNAQEIMIKAVACTFDGSGASGNFLPMLSIVPPGGVGPIECPMLTSVAAGASAEVSWFPGGLAQSTASNVYWLSSNLLYGGPEGSPPDVDLVAAGAMTANAGTAYYQNPGGTDSSIALPLNLTGKGATILGNATGTVADITKWGDTDVINILLSNSSDGFAAGTGPYVYSSQCVGAGYVVKSDGSDFTAFTLVVPELGGTNPVHAFAYCYLNSDGTPVGPTNPWTLASGDVLSCFWDTAVCAWD